MRRLLLGMCLACFIAANAGCCGPCSHWLGWRRCGAGCGGGGCGSCGGGCCEESCAPCGDCGSCNQCDSCGFGPDISACKPWGCRYGRPGGCGEFYWGDWCTGNPHCQTCDNCGNWRGPDSPGGQGQPPNLYSKSHPYGNQVVGGKILPPQGYAPQLVRRMNPNQYSGPRTTQVAAQQPTLAEPVEASAPQTAPPATTVAQAEPRGPQTVQQAVPQVAQQVAPQGAPQLAPQRSQRVSPVQYRDNSQQQYVQQPQYTQRPAQNRYQPSQQPTRRTRPSPYGGDAAQVQQQPMAPQQQQMMQQQPRMVQQPPQTMRQGQPMVRQQPQMMRQSPQMNPQMAPPRGQAGRTGNPREVEGAIQHLGTTDRVVSQEEAAQLLANGAEQAGDQTPGGAHQPQNRQPQNRRPMGR